MKAIEQVLNTFLKNMDRDKETIRNNRLLVKDIIDDCLYVAKDVLRDVNRLDYYLKCGNPSKQRFANMVLNEVKERELVWTRNK